MSEPFTLERFSEHLQTLEKAIETLDLWYLPGLDGFPRVKSRYDDLMKELEKTRRGYADS